MPDFLATALSSPPLAIGLTAAAGLLALVMRYRISVVSAPASGADGNQIYALEVELQRRNQADRAIRLYVYLASRR